eukprot:7257312-Alexandrium_andersonii.AAC.1
MACWALSWVLGFRLGRSSGRPWGLGLISTLRNTEINVRAFVWGIWIGRWGSLGQTMGAMPTPT